MLNVKTVGHRGTHVRYSSDWSDWISGWMANYLGTDRIGRKILDTL